MRDTLEVRVGQILEEIDPRIREAIKHQEFFQELEGRGPSKSRISWMPLWASENFEIIGAKTSKYLKKSRAARAMTTTLTTKYQESTLDYEKNEDPAKMKHSIPDSLSRTGPRIKNSSKN